MGGVKGNKNSQDHWFKPGNCENPKGRPKKEIKWEIFEELCFIHCTISEICSVMNLHDETLKRRATEHYGVEDFNEIYKRFCEGGKSSLRRTQFNLSKKNTAMAIWLGKIWLGQKDNSLEDASKSIIQALSDAGINHKGPNTVPAEDRAPKQAVPDNK